jgi:type IV pilus assembly protein PilV
MDELMTRRRPCNPRRTGLSLIELLVALSVLSVGLLGMLAMQTQALQGSRHGRHVSEAARFAEEQMEFLHRQPWAAVPLSAWSPARIVSGPVNGTGPSAAQPYAISFRVTAGPDLALRMIDVAVTWALPDAPAGSPGSVYNISSVRHNDPGTP